MAETWDCLAPRPLPHHNGSKTITLKGTVTKLGWYNPHIRIDLDAGDEKGEVTHWQCEGGAPNGLVRNGWSHDALKRATP
jgi:hypothetical protein